MATQQFDFTICKRRVDGRIVLSSYLDDGETLVVDEPVVPFSGGGTPPWLEDYVTARLSEFLPDVSEDGTHSLKSVDGELTWVEDPE